MLSPNGIEGAKEDLGSEHDPLNDHMEEIQEKFKTLHQVPAAVSLYEHRLLGVVSGDEEKSGSADAAFSPADHGSASIYRCTHVLCISRKRP